MREGLCEKGERTIGKGSKEELCGRCWLCDGEEGLWERGKEMCEKRERDMSGSEGV